MRSAECQGERRSANELPLQLRIPHSALRIGGRGRVADLPYRVEKPWGFELIWARTDRYVGKILHIEPGHVLSLQYHNKKDESIYVLRERSSCGSSGTARWSSAAWRKGRRSTSSPS